MVFFSEKSCRYKLVVSTSFWSRLLNVSSVLTSLKYTATIFLGYQCVVGLLTNHRSTKFLILDFMFLKYVFCVVVLDAIFCGTTVFIYQDTVWPVKTS